MLFAKGEVCGHTGTCQRDQRQRTPKAGLGLVTGLGNIGNFGDQLVVELRHGGLALQNRNGHIGRQFVFLSSFVGHLGNHIITDTQALNVDLAVFIGHILLREGLTGDIRTLNLEGEALHDLILGGLFDADAAGLGIVDETLAGLVLHDNRHAVLGDLESICVGVEVEADRGGFLLDQITAVQQVIRLIDAIGEQVKSVRCPCLFIASSRIL